jgi:hypothetical protein
LVNLTLSSRLRLHTAVYTHTHEDIECDKKISEKYFFLIKNIKNNFDTLLSTGYFICAGGFFFLPEGNKRRRRREKKGGPHRLIHMIIEGEKNERRKRKRG